MAVHRFGNGLVKPQGGIPDPTTEAAMAGLQHPQIGEPINNQMDPLGAAVRGRSRDTTLQGVQDVQFGSDPMGIQRNAAMQSYINSASDPQGFNTMMQAVKENAPGGIAPAHGRGDPMAGTPNAPFAAPSTMWDNRQTSAVTGKPFSVQQAMQGLKGVR